MNDAVEQLAALLPAVARQLDLSAGFRPRGVIRRVGDGVAFVVGLEEIGYEELLAFDSGASGMAYDLSREGTGAVLLSGADRLRSGEGVIGLRCLPSLPVGIETLGRIIDPLGNPLDDGPPLKGDDRLPLFRPAPEFVDRKSVDQPLLTGVMVIDAAIPIGRGQRELIIGDRNTGKSAIALDMVANQQVGDVACVYVSIGQPMSRVLSLREALQRSGALPNTAIVAAEASMSPGMQYLAPYAGASVAEWFRDRGGHAAVVYDDLTKHADAYRELALLLGRPPGREAFPGDIFYVHAELLERATARRQQSGGGSVTAFPIVETTDSDISGYIPTNLISITDGQIYLDTARFERNQRPAVDIGRSVSRIGSAAQSTAMKTASQNLRILMSRFEAVEALTRVGLDVDESTQSVIRRGRIMRELLRQPRFAHRSTADQVLLLTAVAEGWLDDVELNKTAATAQRLLRRSRLEAAAIMSAVDTGSLPDGWKEALAALAQSSHSGSRVMKREHSLRRRLRSLETLSEAVAAMKSLSAHHFRSARSALPAAHAYQDGIDRALAAMAVHQIETPGDAVAILLIAADLGLCGGYNSKLASAAVAHHARRSAARLYCVGHRPISVLQRASIQVDRDYNSPTSVAGLTELLLRLGEDLMMDYVAGLFGTLHVISAQFDGVGQFTPISTRLLPIDLPETGHALIAFWLCNVRSFSGRGRARVPLHQPVSNDSRFVGIRAWCPFGGNGISRPVADRRDRIRPPPTRLHAPRGRHARSAGHRRQCETTEASRHVDKIQLSLRAERSAFR